MEQHPILNAPPTIDEIRDMLGELEKKAKQSKDKETKGHGRNGVDSYSQADIIQISHQSLKEKDRCPACGKGSYM